MKLRGWLMRRGRAREWVLCSPPTFDTIDHRSVMKKKMRIPEEIVAKQISKLCNDVVLDLDEVGKAIARNEPSISFRRLEIITESAKQEREDYLGRSNLIH
jgi:hypothetical protein